MYTHLMQESASRSTPEDASEPTDGLQGATAVAEPEMQPHKEQPCQSGQHDSQQTSPSFQQAGQPPQGVHGQCQHEKLCVEPGMLSAADATPAVSTADRAADHPSSASKATSVMGTATDAAMLHSAPAAAVDNAAEAAADDAAADDAAVAGDAVDNATTAADGDAAAVAVAAGNSSEAHAAQGHSAGMPSQEGAAKLQHGSGQRANKALHLSGGVMGGELQDKDHFGCDSTLHSVSPTPSESESFGSDDSQLVRSLFCCPITKVSYPAVYWNWLPTSWLVATEATANKADKTP